MSEAKLPDDLASWQEAWRDGPAAAAPPAPELAELVAKVKRSSRRFGFGLLALTVAELLVCVGTLAIATFYVAKNPTPWRLALLALAFLVVVVAEVFVLRNRRGTYRPRNETTQAFVELEWLRTQRQLRTIRWSLPFFLFEIVSMAAVRYGELASDPARAHLVPLFLQRFGLFAAILMLLLTVGTWFWRRQVRRKIAELEPLRAAFAGPPQPS